MAAQWLGQLDDIYGNPSSVILAEQLGRRASPRLSLCPSRWAALIFAQQLRPLAMFIRWCKFSSKVCFFGNANETSGI